MKNIVRLCAAAALCGCAALDLGGRRMSRGEELASADGSVSFRSIGDGETGIALRVENLADPDRLRAPGYVYVAWVREGADIPPHKIGVLDVDARRVGTLNGSTPLRRFQFFVTAESARDVDRPAGPPLLWASRD